MVPGAVVMICWIGIATQWATGLEPWMATGADDDRQWLVEQLATRPRLYPGMGAIQRSGVSLTPVEETCATHKVFVIT